MGEDAWVTRAHCTSHLTPTRPSSLAFLLPTHKSTEPQIPWAHVPSSHVCITRKDVLPSFNTSEIAASGWAIFFTKLLTDRSQNIRATDCQSCMFGVRCRPAHSRDWQHHAEPCMRQAAWAPCHCTRRPVDPAGVHYHRVASFLEMILTSDASLGPGALKHLNNTYLGQLNQPIRGPSCPASAFTNARHRCPACLSSTALNGRLQLTKTSFTDAYDGQAPTLQVLMCRRCD